MNNITSLNFKIVPVIVVFELQTGDFINRDIADADPANCVSTRAIILPITTRGWVANFIGDLMTHHARHKGGIQASNFQRRTVDHIQLAVFQLVGINIVRRTGTGEHGEFVNLIVQLQQQAFLGRFAFKGNFEQHLVSCTDGAILIQRGFADEVNLISIVFHNRFRLDSLEQFSDQGEFFHRHKIFGVVEHKISAGNIDQIGFHLIGDGLMVMPRVGISDKHLV